VCHLPAYATLLGFQLNHDWMLQESESNPAAPLAKADKGFKFGEQGTGPKLGEDNNAS
jgi:hypothetical protein